jgi:hypothetical protein
MYTQFNINSSDTNKNDSLQNLTLAGVAATLKHSRQCFVEAQALHRHWLAIQIYTG